MGYGHVGVAFIRSRGPLLSARSQPFKTQIPSSSLGFHRKKGAMRKATAATASKSRARAKPKAKAKPSPDFSSPYAGAASPTVDLSFLPSSSSPVAKPRTRDSPVAASPAFPVPAGLSTVGDLRSLAASQLDSLKRRLDALHGASVRDLEASHSRISKRVKLQTQSCLQFAEEADKEHRKMADKIAERCEVKKTSYKKFVAEVQASTSRVCKVTLPEMAKSAERSIDG